MWRTQSSRGPTPCSHQKPASSNARIGRDVTAREGPVLFEILVGALIAALLLGIFLSAPEIFAPSEIFRDSGPDTLTSLGRSSTGMLT